MTAFGSAIGGGDPIQQAMARRGMGGGASQQVSPSAPTFNPQTQPPMPPQGGGMAPPPMGGMPPGGSSLPPQGGAPVDSSESALIIKALSSRLASDSKIKENQAIPPAPKF